MSARFLPLHSKDPRSSSKKADTPPCHIDVLAYLIQVPSPPMTFTPIPRCHSVSIEKTMITARNRGTRLARAITSVPANCRISETIASPFRGDVYIALALDFIPLGDECAYGRIPLRDFCAKSITQFILNWKRVVRISVIYTARGDG